MREQKISYETAKLAYEKGFKYNGFWKWSPDSWYNEDCPQSVLQKWLRDVHGIHISIRRSVWYGQVEYNDFIYLEGMDKHEDTTLGNEFDTYEEALENALKEALTNISVRNETNLN